MNLITQKKISCAELIASMKHPECGAVCTFEGTVRNHQEGKKVEKLIYESYVPMAEKALNELKDEIKNEWLDCHIDVRHRIGELMIGDTAVAIVVWAPHRREAFAACQAMIDRIKKRVPIWKKEFFSDGTCEWVTCHHSG